MDRDLFEELNPSLMKKSFKQAVPMPVKLLGWVANGLKLWALVVFFDNPTPTGLVDAAWLYIIAQVLFFVVSGALGLTNGLRQTRFFNTLSETEQWQLARMVLRDQALQGFRGTGGTGMQVFLDWHQTVIKDMLKKKTDQ
jgi:hypothetical protein